jgi:luciferase family oxidoreductase group 1
MLTQLSILDQSASVMGSSHAAVIQQAIELAVFAEELGYHRFWVSEHHSHPSIVGTAPEILMAALSQKTQRIRLGSAGVMLPHYSSLKVAEQFRVLESLAPGRIDLGVGRAPGSDMRTAQLLNPNPQASAYFAQQVQELDMWLRDQTFPPGHPGRGVQAFPLGDTYPELWVLGSSDYGAQLAAHLGLPYVFAHFITDGVGAKEAIELYQQRFQPSDRLKEPQVIVCLWALAAETEEEAFYYFRSRARWKIDRQRGILGSMMPPDQALVGLNQQDLQTFERMCRQGFVGDATTVMNKFEDLADDLGVDEVAIITWAQDFQVRKNSYKVLANQYQTLMA